MKVIGDLGYDLIMPKSHTYTRTEKLEEAVSLLYNAMAVIGDVKVSRENDGYDASKHQELQNDIEKCLNRVYELMA